MRALIIGGTRNLGPGYSQHRLPPFLGRILREKSGEKTWGAHKKAGSV
jgi:hypothetical protein